MPRFFRPRSKAWLRFAVVAGALVAAGALTGCPGSLDPDILAMASTGGTNGSGGGTGGMSASGGSNGNCTGGNDGATLVTSKCATAGCHDTADAHAFAADLDLTVNATLASRLVGVKSTGNVGAGSMCAGNQTPYLMAGSSPAMGLLIDKIGSSPPCGVQMPLVGDLLTAAQTQCFVQWATTLTSAAP